MATRTVTIPGWTFDTKRDPTFLYDDGPHTYMLRGQRIWNWSAVGKSVGVIDDRYYTIASRERGKMIHQALHYMDEGDLHWPDMPPGFQAYLDAYEKFRRDWNFIPQLREVPLYNPDLLYGITPDAAGLILDGEPAIIEIKTGAIPWWAKYQTALQEETIRRWEEKPTWRRRIGLQLKADGTYVPKEFKDARDYVKAQAAVITAQSNESKPLVSVEKPEDLNTLVEI